MRFMLVAETPVTLRTIFIAIPQEAQNMGILETAAALFRVGIPASSFDACIMQNPKTEGGKDLEMRLGKQTCTSCACI